MSTNSIRYDQIFGRLARGKEYREAFVESEINIGIPFQIKAMRETREWTQQQLAERSAKRQSVISQLETPGYGQLTLSTLKKLAAAFDVGLMVRFVSFGELVGRAAHLSTLDMQIPSFEQERPDLAESANTSEGDEVLIVDVTDTPILPQLGDPYPARRAEITNTTEVDFIYGSEETTN